MDLNLLYQLHLVDEAILSLRKRAASLDLGKDIIQEIKQFESTLQIQNDQLGQISKETNDLEQEQIKHKSRLQKINSELYSPGISSKEAKTLEQEIPVIKTRQDEIDTRLFELIDLEPPIEQRIKALKGKIIKLKKDLKVKHAEALKEKESLEIKFKQLMGKRPEVAANVPEMLLKQYESIVKRCHGTGMALVTRENSCKMCGTNLAERILEAVKKDQIATCESCHRLLYKHQQEE